MQDPTSTSVKGVGLVQYPEREQLNCPRCDSTNTKFCYYNNYNLSQPRHFCKSCRRYWTKGGSLRNIPVGGSSRKSSSKRSSSISNKRGPTRQQQDSQQPPSSVVLPTNSTTTTSTVINGDPTRIHLLEGLSFSSLLTSGQLGGGGGGVSEGLSSGSVSGSGHNSSLRIVGGGGGVDGQEGGGYLEGGEWGNNNGWPDLAIFTPGSGFH